MKHYILFTQEELEDMLQGVEIEYFPDGYGYAHGRPIYFACKEHFFEELDQSGDA